MYNRISFLSTLCGALLSFVPCALAMPIDFDGDGASDPTGYEIQFDGSANEIALVYLESSTGTVKRREFGSHKEVPALGDYDGDGLTDFTVVGQQDNGTLLWRSKLSSSGGNTVSTFEFGGADDFTLSGCRFDNDAKTDPAVIRDGNTLFIRKSADASETSLSFNAGEAEAYSCADLDGDGVAELLVQSAAAGSNKAKFFAFRINDGAKLFEVAAAKDIKAFFPIDRDGDGVEEAGYVTKGAAKGTLDIVFLAGDGSSASATLPNASTVAPVARSGAAQPDGLILGKDINDDYTIFASAAALEVSSTVQLFDTEAPYPGVFSSHVGPLFSKEAGCMVQDEPNDGPQGFLWKPVSDTTGTAVFIFPRQYRLRKVRVVKDGVVIDRPPFNGNANGGRDHWKSRRKASTFPKGFTIMGEQKQVTHCFYIPEPGKRLD